MTPLQRSIITTLAYFDLFDYPLTLTELQHYLWQAPSDSTVEQITAAIAHLPQLQIQQGLVMFHDRTQLVTVRSNRYLESERKFKKRLPYIQLLTYLPGIQAIFIVNSLAYYNATENSDIDLLIITTPGKIWSTRFFTTVLAKLLRLRPRPGYTKDTLCLSFYVTSDALELTKLSRNHQDAHQAYWLSQVYPVYDPDHLTMKLFSANTWLKILLPNHLVPIVHPERSIQQTWLQRFSQMILSVFSWEQLLKKLQLNILPAKLKTLNAQPEQIVLLSDTLLKFHTHDPRTELEKKWKERTNVYFYS